MATVMFADDHTVEFDKNGDFSKLRTFAVREGKISSGRQELNNSLVVRKTSDAIRASLTSRGLTESSSQPDVIVEFSASGRDYTIGPGGRASVIDESRPPEDIRGRRGHGDAPVRYSEGTLIIDVKRAQTSELVWRGIYNDHEKNSAKLGQKLPDNARKLLSEYPSRRK
jgi:hypothetical protein